MSKKDPNNLRFFVPETVLGSKKLVDIQSGDFFPFATDEEREHTKQLLTNTYDNVEIKGE